MLLAIGSEKRIAPRNFLSTLEISPFTEVPSIRDLVCDKFNECIDKIPQELLNQPEHVAVVLCHGSRGKIPPIDIVLRSEFWHRYSIAIETGSRIQLTDVYRGTCSPNSFYAILKNPKRLAFILTEPAEEIIRTKAALFRAWKIVENVLDSDDPKDLDRQLKLFAYLRDRVHGKPTEKKEILTAHIDARTKEKPARDLTEDELREELAKYRKLNTLPTGEQNPEILDAVALTDKQVYTTNRNVIESKK